MKARIGIIVFAVTALLSITGCAGTDKAPVKQPAWTPKTVAVIPFMRAEPLPGEVMVRSPLTGTTFRPGGKGGAAALTVLDKALAKNLEGRVDFKVIPLSKTEAILKAKMRKNLGQGLRQALMETGRELGADALLVGHLYRFEQRVGTAASAERPASVAFDLALVNTKNGSVIWKNSFDETQQSLSENLFNFEAYMQHGLRWYSAEEFATYGMAQLLTQFPWLKQKNGE